MHFRLFDSKGSLVDEGAGSVKFVAGAIVVVPEMGEPMTIRPNAIGNITEPAPFVVGIVQNDS